MAGFEDIIKYIEFTIANRPLGPGDEIPSEHELAVAFGESEETARGAINALVFKGRLLRVDGGEVIVAAPDQPLWTDSEYARLKEIEATVIDLIEVEEDVASERVSAIADEDERDDAELYERLRRLVGKPPSTEPEIQHQRRCPHPTAPCTCRRSHLLNEGRRLSGLIHAAELGDET